MKVAVGHAVVGAMGAWGAVGAMAVVGAMGGASRAHAEGAAAGAGVATSASASAPAPASATPAAAAPAAAASAAPAATATPPKATPTPAPTPTPKPTPALPPAPPSTWLKQKTFILSEGNKGALGLPESSRAEVIEATRDEQFSLPPSQSGAAQKEMLFFQRRYTPSDRFAIFSKAASDSQSGELLRNMPQIYDALVYCPLSNEIVFQAPPQDANGRFNVRARPTRVYLFSLETGRTELIWRRDKDREGTFVPRMSATPDCRHVLLNLALETPGNKIPYGELVYLRRPKAVDGGRKGPPQIEWTFATINESSRNGVWRGFGEALFVQPRDPRRYVPSELPPAVFAITSMVEKDRNKPLVNVFTPSGGARISQAAGVRWSRDRIPAEDDVRDLFSPSVPDAADGVFLIMESNQAGAAGVSKRALVSFQPSALSAGMKRLVEGDGVRFHSADVHPSGTRIAASYTFERTAAQAETLEKRDIGGVAEITANPGGVAAWAQVATMLPFHGLDGHNDPRPVYAADGATLYYVHPQVGDLPETGLFAAGAKPNRELQFGAKLMRIDVPAN